MSHTVVRNLLETTNIQFFYYVTSHQVRFFWTVAWLNVKKKPSKPLPVENNTKLYNIFTVQYCLVLFGKSCWHFKRNCSFFFHKNKNNIHVIWLKKLTIVNFICVVEYSVIQISNQIENWKSIIQTQIKRSKKSINII